MISCNFRNRAYKIYTVNCPRTILYALKLVSNVLDDIIKSKVIFCDSNIEKKLLKHVNKVQL